MKSVVITIGRQFGSGGHELGRKLAERLHIPFYDRELLSEAAARSDLTKEMIESLDEQPTSSFLYSLTSGTYGFNSEATLPLGNRAFLAMTETIRDIASRGSCVIVGRCAEYILAEHPDLIRVFVRGEKDARIARITAHLNVTEKEAAAMMAKTDKKRASYHDFYSDDRWGAAASYDIIVNSSKIGIDNAVDMIAQYVENR